MIEGTAISATRHIRNTDNYHYVISPRACGAYGGGERCAQGSGGET